MQCGLVVRLKLRGAFALERAASNAHEWYRPYSLHAARRSFLANESINRRAVIPISMRPNDFLRARNNEALLQTLGHGSVSLSRPLLQTEEY